MLPAQSSALVERLSSLPYLADHTEQIEHKMFFFSLLNCLRIFYQLRIKAGFVKWVWILVHKLSSTRNTCLCFMQWIHVWPWASVGMFNPVMGVFLSWGCTVVLACGPSPKHWKDPSSHQWWDSSSHCWDPLCPSSLGAFRSCGSAVSGPLLGLRSLGCGCCPMCLGLSPSHSSYFHILSSRYSCSLEHADSSFLPGLERSPSLWLPLQGPPFSPYFLRDT